MTLTTHMVVATAVTKPLARLNPVIGFCAAVASHYLSDAIPHWDYQIHAMKDKGDGEKQHWNASKAQTFRKEVIRDVHNFAIDGLLGATVTLALIRPASAGQWWWAAAAIIGGALPDFLQGLYLSGFSLLKPLQRIHDRMHTKIKLGAYPAIGIPFQLVIALVAASFLI